MVVGIDSSWVSHKKNFLHTTAGLYTAKIKVGILYSKTYIAFPKFSIATVKIS